MELAKFKGEFAEFETIRLQLVQTKLELAEAKEHSAKV